MGSGGMAGFSSPAVVEVNYSDDGSNGYCRARETQQRRAFSPCCTARLPPTLIPTREEPWEVTAQPGARGPGCLRLGKAVGSLLPLGPAEVRCASGPPAAPLLASPHLSLWKPPAAWKLPAEDGSFLSQPGSLDECMAELHAADCTECDKETNFVVLSY